ncbi:Bul1 N terminus-domain-containing protein [Scheffersomyces xylosifermentans]|uniref:Bul1 N terminus-domain-containing protein n=1 Tax=Scheffersomyces xylosifermentans TaxID=1304137 RepID=UPI00315D2A72
MLENSSSGLNYLRSPAHENTPIWNILPSYQMYQSTFSKSIRPSSEDLRVNPPAYEGSSSSRTVEGYFPMVPDRIPESALESVPRSIPIRSQPYTSWETSILGNTHKLKRVEDFDPKAADSLKVTIQMTKNICERGEKPTLLDSQYLEYKQGDSLSGFITIENTSNKAIPFDMFFVVLEGKSCALGEHVDPKNPLLFYKFLNMFDYNASWTPAFFNGDEFDEDHMDPIDNTVLRLPMEKYFEPKVKYKRFFNFVLPEKLLDCACEVHNLSKHCELIPTFGLARDQFLKRLKETRTVKQPSQNNVAPTGVVGILDSNIKDLSFPGTSISYSVEARIVGRSSDYVKTPQTLEPEDAEFIILNESSLYFRVIPKERLSIEYDKSFLERESKRTLKSLKLRVENKIELGKQKLGRGGSSESNGHVELPKYKYSNNSNTNNTNASPKSEFDYEALYPLRKKQLTTVKVVGIVSISTPVTDYIITYCPPRKFREVMGGVSATATIPVNIPITLMMSVGDKKSFKPPEIKAIRADLVAVTFRTQKYPIPIEITNDLIFQNKPDCKDNLDIYVAHPFRRYRKELANLENSLGSDFSLEPQLVMDVKALSNLTSKYNSLRIDDVAYKTRRGWLLRGNSSENDSYCLVPNFQSCIVGRSYYISISVKLSNNEVYIIKVPLTIQNH